MSESKFHVSVVTSDGAGNKYTLSGTVTKSNALTYTVKG